MLPRLVVDADPTARAAEHIARRVRVGPAQVAFSGGRTPWRMVDQLARYDLPGGNSVPRFPQAARRASTLHFPAPVRNRQSETTR